MDTPQFRKAEFAGGGPPCAVCKGTITGEYYRLSTGPTICPDCTAKFQEQQKAPSHAAFVRGILYGSGMALACCIGYAAVLMLTGLEIGLVAILVGYLVGTAVRKGSQGLGGRRCQIAAVGLTYLAITFSYIPVGIQEMRKASQATKGKQEQTVKQTVPAPTASNIAVAVVMLAGFAIATPF